MAAGILTFSFIILFFFARKEKVVLSKKIPFLLLPFYKLTVFVLYGREWYWKLLLKSKKVKAGLGRLYPNDKVEKSCREYYLDKFSKVFMVLFTGSVLSFLFSFMQDIVLMEGDVLVRNPLGQGSREITLHAEGEKTGLNGSFTYSVLPKKYTNEELEELYDIFLSALEETILSKNTDRNRIREDMKLVTTIDGYPFTLDWSTSDYTLMNYEGRIQRKEINRDGELIELTAVISCDGFQKIYNSFVRVYPPLLTEQGKFLQSAKREVQKQDEKYQYQDKWKLPEKIDGETVIWKEGGISKGIIVLVLSGLTAAAVFFLKDNDLKKQIRKKEEELLWDYPSVVSRLTLFLNAGMTIRTAWRKTAGSQDNSGKKGYIYQEMQFTCYEIDSGIPETDAYERFGKRCALQPYIKLVTLLAQNVKKGNSVLIERLKEETQLTLLERKNRIKIVAEEASTKLLVPMIMMMTVVMILIMVPALSSF